MNKSLQQKGLIKINKKGMTLVEVIVVIGIIGIIATIIGNIFIFGNKSFRSSDVQSINQMNVRLAAGAISRELRYATEIELVDVNTDFKEGKKYIYYDTVTKRLLKRDGYKPALEFLKGKQTFSDINFKVTKVETTKSDSPGSTLNFSVFSNSEARKNYEINSAISLPNLKRSLESLNDKNGNFKMIRFEDANMEATFEDGTESKTFWNNLMEDYENKKVLLAHQANMNKSYSQKQGKDGEIVQQFESIVISGNKQGKGAMIFKDMRDYVNDITDYTITVDAHTLNKGGGWGILLNGLVEKGSNGNVKDDGYMLQFDPGANGIVIRQIHGGDHSSINSIGVKREDNRIRNYNNSYFPTDFVNENFKMKDLDPQKQGIRKSEDAYYSTSWTDYRYKTEIQVKIDKSKGMLIDVTLIDTKGNRSNTIKFGDFGTYTLNNKKFTGLPLNFVYKDGDGKFTSTWENKKDKFPGSYIGLRSWNGTAYGTEHETKFYGVDIESTKK